MCAHISTYICVHILVYIHTYIHIYICMQCYLDVVKLNQRNINRVSTRKPQKDEALQYLALASDEVRSVLSENAAGPGKWPGW